MCKILSAPLSGIKLPFRACEARPLCFEDIFTLVHVRGQGSEEPTSPRETRQVLDKQSKAFEFCHSKVPEQTCSRSGESTHECVSVIRLVGTCVLGHKL